MIRRLEDDLDLWVATASESGAPDLVPLPYRWDAEAIQVATPAGTPAGRKLLASRAARLMLGHARDVVIIDGAVEPFALGSLNHQPPLTRFARMRNNAPRSYN